MSNPVYFTKGDAAKYSGLSIRRIQELAKAGVIRRHYQRDEKTNRNVALFLAEDLQSLVERRMRGEDTRLSPWKPAAPTITPSTQWLTLADAAVITGLPEIFLLELVERGKLPAFDVGVRPGGRYRVSRRALDALEAPTHIGRYKKKRIGR